MSLFLLVIVVHFVRWHQLSTCFA